VNLDSLGESITSAVVASWSKKAGDAVNEDDVIAVVETDKVTMDIRAKEKGVFVEALVAAKGEVRLTISFSAFFLSFFLSFFLFFFLSFFLSATSHRLPSELLFIKSILPLLQQPTNNHHPKDHQPMMLLLKFRKKKRKHLLLQQFLLRRQRNNLLFQLLLLLHLLRLLNQKK
jgi:hypothetical protein